MRVKVIAIGNSLMHDDGTALYFAKELRKKFEHSNVDIVIGETDFDYCMEKIHNDDFIIVIDSTNFFIRPGTVTISSLDLKNNNAFCSGHYLNFVQMVRCFYPDINGAIIGIEGKNFEVGIGLSDEIINNSTDILKKIYKVVYYFQKKWFKT